MKYNLADPNQLTEAKARLIFLAGLKKRVDIKVVNPKRTLPQNRYLHLLLGYFGQHFGYTVEESKLIYKEVNKSIYFYEKKGRTFMRSSADLTTEEMTKSIDRFREKSAEAGFPLPAPTDQGWLEEIEREIERSERYL